MRLDAALVARSLVRSRAVATEAVRAGRVRVDGVVARKPAQPVAPTAGLEVETGVRWVSRAAGKLAPAVALLTERGVTVRDRRCLDVGAGTGGFTQVLLRAGAARVYAVDVGHGQLVPELRADPRVVDLPGRHVRDLTLVHLDGAPVERVVVDVSFISLTAVLPVLSGLLAPGGHAVCLVKPQFEAGREALDKHGVVTDPDRHLAVLRDLLRTAADAGLRARGLWTSRVVGTHGNREHLLWLASRGRDDGDDAEAASAAEQDRVAATVPEVVAEAFAPATRAGST